MVLPFVSLKGCPAEIFESYGNAQSNLIRSELNLHPEDTVFEIGCGVGRLVIPASGVLSRGFYLALDIIKPSIDLCSATITAPRPNFRFIFEDVNSPLHNPQGTKRVADVIFPVSCQSVDKIIPSSVFTHMCQTT
jgi:tRNA G46 methylase TrmB